VRAVRFPHGGLACSEERDGAENSSGRDLPKSGIYTSPRCALRTCSTKWTVDQKGRRFRPCRMRKGVRFELDQCKACRRDRHSKRRMRRRSNTSRHGAAGSAPSPAPRRPEWIAPQLSQLSTPARREADWMHDDQVRRSTHADAGSITATCGSTSTGLTGPSRPPIREALDRL